jgi:hypothetical protein
LNLEKAIDELYGVGLESFVAERGRLVEEARGAGHGEEARAIAGLRKPTVAAWVLNQLSRRHRRDVDLLLDAGHRLRDAQAGLLAGEAPAGFEDARKTELESLRRLKAHAEQLMSSERGQASTATLRQVEESLRAAAVSESGRELLARGRFVEPIHAEGFDVINQIAAGARPRAASRKQARPDERREAEAALRQATSKLRDAERAARDAELEAERLQADSARARKAAEGLRARADRAAAGVQAAEERVRQSRRR